MLVPMQATLSIQFITRRELMARPGPSPKREMGGTFPLFVHVSVLHVYIWYIALWYILAIHHATERNARLQYAKVVPWSRSEVETEMWTAMIELELMQQKITPR